ncbi:hypothetical protein CTAM01_06840 [Colletotrichum tamarilloi]|uniref:Uncharacterized protein n=1 Tax=Colletotrichum tamarilloi TaxID=1209934 RepID=A0ABQ9RA93_9PEZI|nr:uncharacterized protein CTAM01_06840 [Colletotrichum tamarilloi]KAK1499646.1 hypothetical protein CTAM01_06840 [Colletotrichum tamarilloi]
MQEMIISTVLLFFGLEDLVPASDIHLTTRWRVRTLSHEAWGILVVRPTLAVVMLVSTHFNLFNSMLGELSWLMAILLWGTSKVMSAHYEEKYYAKKDQEQQPDKGHSLKWEFGQVLPVLLLAAPLVAVIGTFASPDDSGEANHPSRRLESTGFGTVGDRRLGHQQSDGNSWELARFSAPETNSTAQRRGGNVPSRAETDNAESMIAQNQRISGRNVFAKDHYRETLWMSPYITFSFVTIWAHVFFLFWFATDAFLVPDFFSSGPSGKLINSLDYLFTWSSGVFYLVLAGYPVACHSTILFGLTIDQGTNARLTITRNSSRKPLFWLWTLGVYSVYAIYTYLTFDVKKQDYVTFDVMKQTFSFRLDNVGKFAILGRISAGLYALYLLGCLVQMATTWKNLRASERL